MSQTLDNLVAACIRQVLGLPADRPVPDLDACRCRVQLVLDYHRPRFAQAKGRIFSDTEVFESLRQGDFGTGRREGYDLAADVVLVALLEAGQGCAVEAFERRFGEQVQRWTNRFASDLPQFAEDFLGHLLEPRKTTGSRLATYQGQAPLDGWLRQVLRSVAEKERQKRGLVLDPEPGNRVCRIEPGDEYAQQDCSEKLSPAFERMFDSLDDAHRTILQMSIVDGVEQKKIAGLFGVPDYKVTRMKQKALEQVATQFQQYAVGVLRMGRDSVRECLELLLERFPQSGLGGLIRLGPRPASD